MEHTARLHIEKFPEVVYLATSEDVPGLAAQGCTIAEKVEIARDIAKKLIEARGGDPRKITRPVASDDFEFPLVLGV